MWLHAARRNAPPPLRDFFYRTPPPPPPPNTASRRQNLRGVLPSRWVRGEPSQTWRAFTNPLQSRPLLTDALQHRCSAWEAEHNQPTGRSFVRCRHLNWSTMIKPRRSPRSPRSFVCAFVLNVFNCTLTAQSDSLFS